MRRQSSVRSASVLKCLSVQLKMTELNKNQQLQIRHVLKQCHNGNLSALVDFHEKHPKIPMDVFKYDASGDTILHHAAKLGNLPMVTYLLAHFSSNCRNKDNKTPLHEACQFGHLEVARMLLQNGADVDALKKADWTPLMLACTKIEQGKSLQLIALLVENGAQLNFRNKDGWSTLHLIVREGDREILQFLIGRGLEINKKTNNGNSAMHIAALHGHIDIVNTLHQIDMDSDSGSRAIHNLNNQGNLPLHEAVLSKNLDIVRGIVAFYDHPEEITRSNKSGFNIMHLSAFIGSLDILSFIVESLHFDVQQVTELERQTCLHLAARNQFWDIYQYCVKSGVDPAVRDKFGRLSKDYNKLEDDV